MIRVACAIAIAAVTYAAVSTASNAAPIGPLPAAITTDDAIGITPVYYWHGRYYPYRWHGGYYHHRYYRYGH